MYNRKSKVEKSDQKRYDKKLKAINDYRKKYGIKKIAIANLVNAHPYWIGKVLEGVEKGHEVNLLDKIIEAFNIPYNEE